MLNVINLRLVQFFLRSATSQPPKRRSCLAAKRTALYQMVVFLGGGSPVSGAGGSARHSLNLGTLAGDGAGAESILQRASKLTIHLPLPNTLGSDCYAGNRGSAWHFVMECYALLWNVMECYGFFRRLLSISFLHCLMPTTTLPITHPVNSHVYDRDIHGHLSPSKCPWPDIYGHLNRPNVHKCL